MGERIAVVGGGAWGTALAAHLASCGHGVRLFVREPDLVERMRERGDNPVYLPGVVVPRTVAPTADPAEAVRGASLTVFVVPTPYAREVYRASSDALPDGSPVVVGCKGIEEDTLALPLEVAEEVVGGPERLAIVSGPSFADEVARGAATALAVAARDGALALRVQEVLSGRNLRLYTNDDPVGVQVAGALKNVIAIAAGIVEGMGLGHNALAALVTRGLAEISRLGVAMGGKPETFAGLAGLGDLVLTCTGDLSRNRSVGRELARGARLGDVLSGTRHVPEGVRTAASARRLAARHGVEMPIVEEVGRILHDEVSPRDAVERLMARPLRSEEASA